MPKKKLVSGVIDPISLIGVLLLIVTLVVGTKVTNDRSMSLNISEKAAKLEKTGNAAFDKCREESGREVCNERLGINVNWKGEIVNEIDTSKVDKDAPQGQPTCDANGVQYSPGAVVMYGGIGSNATCGADGKWDVGVGATKDIITENLPEYAKESDKLKKQIEDEKAIVEVEKQAAEQQAIEQDNLNREKSQCLQEGGSWFANICSYAEQQQAIAKLTPIIQEQQEQKTQAAIQTQPTVTTETSPVNQFANITAGVSGGTISNASKPYVHPLLLTVPTAEDLLRKIPGLEKLNINDIKNFNYPVTTQEENKKTLLGNLASLSTQFSNALNNSGLEGLGTYGLGGGNAYVAPVPQNIIKSQNNSDLYNYMLGNTISAGAGVASATLLTPGAPMFVFETAISIPGAIRLLTAADIADNIVTGGACALGNQESCSYFQSTLFIPAPTGVGNMLVDSIEDFSTSWAGTGSTINKLINKIPSPALFNPSSSFDSFIPTNTTTDLANAISPTQTDMFFAPALDNLPNTPARVIMDDLQRPLPDAEISNPVTTIQDLWKQNIYDPNVGLFPNWKEVGNNPVANSIFGNPVPKTLDIANVSTTTNVTAEIPKSSQISDWWKTNIVDEKGWLPWLRTPTKPVVEIPITPAKDIPSQLESSKAIALSPEEPYGLVSPPQNVKTWVADMPVPKFNGPGVGDVQDTGELLERYASHWEGQYDSQSLKLILNPKNIPTTSKNGADFYDNNLATVENGIVTPLPNSGYSPLRANEFGHILVSDSEVPSIVNGQKLIFRGINYEGMQTALKDGSLNSGPLMKSWGAGDDIYFAPNAQRAFGYSGQGEGVYAMATFEKPSFVVVLKQPDKPNIDIFGDIIISKPITFNEIEKIYEIRPYFIKPGAIPGVDDIRNVSGVNVQKMTEIGEEPFMNLPDIFTQIDNGPKGQFVYREITLNEVEDVFRIKAPKLNPEPNQTIPTIPSPLTGISKFQEQVGSFGQKVMDGSLSTGAGLSPLKYVAGGIVSAAFLDNYFDWGITDPVYDTVNFWINNASIIYALNNDKELSEISVDNPNQRPYDEIIQEAIGNYTENNPDSDVYYSPNPQALSLVDIFKQLFSRDSLDIISSTLVSENYEKLKFSGKIMRLSNNLLTDRNSFIGSVIGAAGNIGLYTKDGGTYPINGFDNEVKSLVVLIEEEFQATGRPVSHSFVIEYFLQKNNGDLAQSILDSSNFEEFLLRSSEYEIVGEPYVWIQNHILDEYSPLLPYQRLPDQEDKLENSTIYYDYSLPNRLGEIYHAASITALLNYLPPEIIKGMVISEYLSYGNKHGLIKLSADLEVLKQLDNINDLLDSYNVLKTPIDSKQKDTQDLKTNVNTVVTTTVAVQPQAGNNIQLESIKSGLYAQTDPDIASTLIPGGAGKPFKNIGCGQTTVANILCEYSSTCPTPIEVANMIPLNEYDSGGLTSTQSNIKILNKYGFTADPYRKSLEFHLTEYMEPNDILWISANVGGISHHTYLDGYSIDSNGTAIYNLNDSYFGDGFKCKTTSGSSFGCINNDGTQINIAAENANIYIIDTN